MEGDAKRAEYKKLLPVSKEKSGADGGGGDPDPSYEMALEKPEDVGSLVGGWWI